MANIHQRRPPEGVLRNLSKCIHQQVLEDRQVTDYLEFAAWIRIHQVRSHKEDLVPLPIILLACRLILYLRERESFCAPCQRGDTVCLAIDQVEPGLKI